MKFLAILTFVVAGSVLAEEKKDMPIFTDSGHTTDELAVVKARVESKQAVLLDVREDDEWADGHLKHAALMPLSEVRKGEIPEKYLKILPKDKPVYLHCQAGGRTVKCAEVLKEKGYDIRPLKAGYPKLLEFGFEKAPVKAP